MTTRTIVTSQPDVACDVCARRLLRGEQPDVFVAAGRRRLVCELCAPRATHAGWLRESETPAVSLPPLRPRRGRSFFERLRQVARPPGEATGRSSRTSNGPGVAREVGGGPYDFLDSYGREQGEQEDPRAGAALDDRLAAAESSPLPVGQTGTASEAVTLNGHGLAGEDGPANGDSALPLDSYAALAIDVFNRSEFPRRVAGVARSLGAPEVNVREAEHLASVVRIVVAWELCWYRYEVDLSEPVAETRVLAQGTELSELAHEERLVNALAEESGALRLAL